MPVKTNEKLRESRLFKSNWSYIKRSVGTIFRIYTMYEPLRTFAMIGAVLFGSGVLIGLRFLYFFLTGNGGGHVQSLILAAILTIVGFQVGMIGLLADLIGSNRRLIEDALYRLKRIELNGSVASAGSRKSSPKAEPAQAEPVS